jgi:hypothetical protein
MTLTTDTKLRIGSSLVAMSYVMAGFATYSILSARPDMHTQTGRHLLAGALTIVSLSAVEVLIAIFSLSRGERWAFWATMLPLLSLVLPVMLIDATHVAPGHLLITLIPFAVGLILAIVGLALVSSHRKN